jgi:rRNA maturation RNase YbeY
MAVVVTTRDCRAPALAARLARSARRVLVTLGRRDAELSVVLVSDRAIRRLNRTWRGKDRTTDVLSFPQQEGAVPAPAALLGDVVISVPTARRQAKERDETLAVASERLLIHGILHLLGYDHERSAAEERRMARRERQLARALER